MANITQKVTSYVHGISYQPDHLKRPGQVRNLENGLPDITYGLLKRPGSEIIKKIEGVTEEGKWFTIFRDDREKYLVRHHDGQIRVWSLIDGEEKTVTYAADPEGKEMLTEAQYLKEAPPKQIDVLTVNDYTFLTNKLRTVKMGGTKANERPHEAFVLIKVAEYNSQYDIAITAPDAVQDKEVTGATSLSTAPPPKGNNDASCGKQGYQSFTVNGPAGSDKVNLSFSLLTSGQPTNYDPNGEEYADTKCNYSTQVILNNGGSGWEVGDSVNVSMNGHTYTVRVNSIGKSMSYTKIVPTTPFLTVKDQSAGAIKYYDILNHFATDINKVTGWEATVIGPGLYIKGPEPFAIYGTGGRTDDTMYAFTDKINNVSKLPAQCKDGYVVKVYNTGEVDDDYYVKFNGQTAGVDGAGTWEETVKPGIPINLDYQTMPHQLVRQADGSFVFQPVDWDLREVGDERTNPEPSYVDKEINKLFFYRNRLGMLSDENIILSRPGDFFNFFVHSAITVTDGDPIDLAATSTSPCELHDAVGTKIGLILFSRDKQFYFGTSQDILSASTAKLETLSTFDYNEHLPVVNMGTTLGFTSTSGEYSRFFEMSNLSDTAMPEILEQSKIVSEMLPSNLDELAESRESTIIGFGKRGTEKVHFFRYFNNGQERLLSSWFNWTLPGNLIYHTIDKDVYYSVVHAVNEVFIAKQTLSVTSEDYVVRDTFVTYAPRLDLRATVKQADITYNKATNQTTFSVPWRYGSDIEVFVAAYGPHQGRSAKPIGVNQNFGTPSSTTITMKGDWSQTDLVVGYPFEMKVEFPTIFMTKEDGKQVISDTRSYLTVHRIKMQLADIGLFTLTATAPSKKDRVFQWEMSPGDLYRANTHEVLPSIFQTIPAYEKNLHLNLTLTSSHPTPAALLSMEWEGKLSTKAYQRV